MLKHCQYGLHGASCLMSMHTSAYKCPSGVSLDVRVSASASACLIAGAQCVGALCRNCLGQQLAKINMPTAVAMLTREFHLTLAPQVRVYPDGLLQYLASVVCTIIASGALSSWRSARHSWCVLCNHCAPQWEPAVWFQAID